MTDLAIRRNTDLIRPVVFGLVYGPEFLKPRECPRAVEELYRQIAPYSPLDTSGGYPLGLLAESERFHYKALHFLVNKLVVAMVGSWVELELVKNYALAARASAFVGVNLADGSNLDPLGIVARLEAIPQKSTLYLGMKVSPSSSQSFEEAGAAFTYLDAFWANIARITRRTTAMIVPIQEPQLIIPGWDFAKPELQGRTHAIYTRTRKKAPPGRY